MQLSPKDRAAKAMGLPYDTVMGYPLLHAAGNLRVRLENHQGVRAMSDTQMVFATPRGTVALTGKGLTILKMDRDEVTIEGKLDSIDLSELS